MTDNILEALGVLHHEDTITNLLAYCVNSSPRFASTFAAALVDGEADSYQDVRAYTRKHVRGTGIPDLVLKARSGDKCDLIVIENKLKAGEGKDQTERYASDKCVNGLRKMLAAQPPNGDWAASPHFAFLTLFPRQKPLSPVFRHVTYREVLARVASCPTGGCTLSDRLIENLRRAYMSAYEHGHPQSGDLIAGKLLEGEDLASSFLYFQNLFADMRYPADLRTRLIDRWNGGGKVHYYAAISKDRWMSEPEDGMPGVHIHFEARLDALKSSFTLCLHHEPRIWKPRSQQRREFGEAKMAQYEVGRQRFIEYLKQKQLPGLKIGGGVLQVATMPIELNEATRLENFSRDICSAMADVAKVIDAYPELPQRTPSF